MNTSRAIAEYHIRKPLNRDLRLEALPPDVQGVAAKLLCLISDAALDADSDAVEELRKVASKLAPKTTRKDLHQSDRPLVAYYVRVALQSFREADEIEDPDSANHERRIRAARDSAVKLLKDGLTLVDPAFSNLDTGSAARELRLARPNAWHKIAATFTVDCQAFGETKSPGRIARTDRIREVARLSVRAEDI